MFSPSFMRSLNNHSSSTGNHLHTAAKRCLARIAALRSSSSKVQDDHLQAALTAALSRHPGFSAAPAAAAAPPVPPPPLPSRLSVVIACVSQQA